MRRRRSTRKFVNLNGRVSLPIDYEQCCIDRLNPPPILLKNSISAPVRNSGQRNHGCAEERSLPSRLFLRPRSELQRDPHFPRILVRLPPLKPSDFFFGAEKRVFQQNSW